MYFYFLTISSIDVIIYISTLDIICREAEILPREQFQTLSEPMYYILLALQSECSGVDVMNRVKEISGGRVVIGPGTLYALLQKFVDNGIITETKTSGRMRWYIITKTGKTLLDEEFLRLRTMCNDKLRAEGELQ